MNKKRQTVWLVSMLSIMVILSAYYLFTDNVNEMDLATGEDQTDPIVMDMLNDVDGNSEEHSDPLAMSGDNGALSDEDILEEFETQTASAQGTLLSLEMARDEAFSQRIEELTAKTTDASLPDEEVKAAVAEIQKLQTMIEKIDMIEEQLMMNYGYENAIIEQEGEEWVVNIQADQLANTEVVSILELVMGELDIRPENITVVRHS